MNLYVEMRAFADAHERREPEELAEMFAGGCHLDDLLPLLVSEFKRLQRQGVRAIEIETLRASNGRPRLRSAESVRASLADLAPLLDKPYRIGDGHPRLFRQMTRDEHLTRIMMLAGHVAGVQRAITAHEDAVALIDKCGVTCLDEIEAGVVAA